MIDDHKLIEVEKAPAHCLYTAYANLPVCITGDGLLKGWGKQDDKLPMGIALSPAEPSPETVKLKP